MGELPSFRLELELALSANDEHAEDEEHSLRLGASWPDGAINGLLTPLFDSMPPITGK